MSSEPNKSEQQKVAEAEVEEFKEDLGPFVVAAETTRMAMVFADAKETDHPIIFANDAFLSLTGYGREEVLGQSFNFLMAHAADAEALAQIEAEFQGSSGDGCEVKYRRKDGSEFWAALFITPVRDEEGDIVQYFASFVDLTRHKAEEAQSKILIGELNHRVKNTLAIVQSIIWEALRMDADPKAIREVIETRLSALSRSHDLLTRENWRSAGLVDVIHGALEPFGIADGRADRLVIKGENIRFPPKAALALGITFNELATNAVKYGAFSNDKGSIHIAWTVEQTPEGPQLVLLWQEKDGPPVSSPFQTGFGSKVIERGLAYQLKGTAHLDYQKDGVVCKMVIPMAAPNFAE
jgi:PAS domain S-box-containing protein